MWYPRGFDPSGTAVREPNVRRMLGARLPTLWMLIVLTGSASQPALAGLITVFVDPGTVAGLAWATSDGLVDSTAATDTDMDGIISFEIPEAEQELDGLIVSVCKRLDDRCIYNTTTATPGGVTFVSLEPFDIPIFGTVAPEGRAAATIDIEAFLKEGNPFLPGDLVTVTGGIIPDTATITFKDGATLPEDPLAAAELLATSGDTLPNLSADVEVQVFDLFRRPADVVINEIDYDQAGTDSEEWIELVNVSDADVDLAELRIDLVNGTGGGATVYNSIVLPTVTLAPGGYYVVCGDIDAVQNCDLDADPDTNLIQNGAPDAVALVEVASESIVDTVSYEGDTGAPYTEVSGSGLEDDSTIDFFGISRSPDGIDANVNNVDFSPRCMTPGESNSTAIADCMPLSIGGDCPGIVTVTVRGGMPSGLGGVLYSATTGSDPVPAGPCAGTLTELSNPQLFTLVTFDADGEVELTPNAQAGACGLFVQVVDATTCNVSNVASP